MVARILRNPRITAEFYECFSTDACEPITSKYTSYCCEHGTSEHDPITQLTATTAEWVWQVVQGSFLLASKKAFLGEGASEKQAPFKDCVIENG